MQEFTESSPLPMRYPATEPPVKGDHIDIGVWPNGWRFMTTSDRLRFERMSEAEQTSYRRSFDLQGEAIAERADTSEDTSADHGLDTCPDCGNAGTKIGPDGYEPCTRFRSCWSD